MRQKLPTVQLVSLPDFWSINQKNTCPWHRIDFMNHKNFRRRIHVAVAGPWGQNSSSPTSIHHLANVRGYLQSSKGPFSIVRLVDLSVCLLKFVFIISQSMPKYPKHTHSHCQSLRALSSAPKAGRMAAETWGDKSKATQSLTNWHMSWAM